MQIIYTEGKTLALPDILSRNIRNIQTIRGIMGYAMCDMTDKPKQRCNMENFAEIANTIGSEDYRSCFILNTVVSNLQERQQVQSKPCIR